MQERDVLGTTLAETRKRRGMSQRKLAELSGISNTMIASIERGRGSRGSAPVRPSPDTLRLLAAGLSTDLLDGHVDDAARAFHYERLMRAAGYLADPEPALESRRRDGGFEDVVDVPVMRVRVQASGQPTWDDTRETVVVSSHLAAGRPNIRAAIVSGACMEPYVTAGERIVFDPDAHPQDRDMVVVSDEDGATLVKWFRVDPLGRRYLRAADGTMIRPNGAKIEGVVLAVVRQVLRDPEP